MTLLWLSQGFSWIYKNKLCKYWYNISHRFLVTHLQLAVMSLLVSTTGDLFWIPPLSNSGILPLALKAPTLHLLSHLRDPKTVHFSHRWTSASAWALRTEILGKVLGIGMSQSSPRPQIRLSGSSLWPTAISEWEFHLLVQLRGDGVCYATEINRNK